MPYTPLYYWFYFFQKKKEDKISSYTNTIYRDKSINQLSKFFRGSIGRSYARDTIKQE